MNKFLALLIFLISFNNFAQENNILDKPKVDERVELLSIIFRLASAEEYNSKIFKLYTDKIEDHFEKYKDHELIQFAKVLNQENGIGFDGVMRMAIHLGPSPEFLPLVKFSDSIPSEKWGKNDSEKFVRLLKEFYIDAKCKEFFASNQNFYKSASTKFLPIYEHIDLEWYKSFYGKEPNEKFIIVNGLGNGGANYGVDVVLPNNSREVYAIMGTWTVDSLGMAEFGFNDYFPILIHEFNHSFVNNLIDKNIKKLGKSGVALYKVVGKKMADQAYTDYKIMLSEALVRAAVIRYMKDHDFEKIVIEKEIKDQIDKGFFWIKELDQELEKYSKQRKKYPTLKSYMPQIISAYDQYARNIDLLKKSN